MKEELGRLIMKKLAKRNLETIGRESMGRSQSSNLIGRKRNRSLLEVIRGVRGYDRVKQKKKVGNNPS